MTPREAAARSAKVHFDYGDLTTAREVGLPGG